jgi:glycoprotein endo-alpha-1,2-mannosidase
VYAPRGLVRVLSAVVAAAVSATVLVVGQGSARTFDPAGLSRSARVGIFFYPWYGTPTRDGGYEHWGQRGLAPPLDIASNFFPARGIYSSSDPAVLRSQMRYIAAAGVGTVIVSWWGRDSAEDVRLPAVVAAATAYGLQVAVHLEPYAGRTPATVREDVVRLRALGISDFYVYDSATAPDADWLSVNRSLSGVRLFANTPLAGKAAAGGFTGLYTYDVYLYDGTSFRRMCEAARKLRLLCAPSVGPGYEAERATGDLRYRPRLDGATYDSMWRRALRARADLVTITSYNEWHEGTQIEPARPGRPGYESYAGAWGLYGQASETAYLDRTAQWVARLEHDH